MTSICHRCALRLQRAVGSSGKQQLTVRAFSGTPSRAQRAPDFTETSNAELNNVLLTLRDKHLIPASLKPVERRFIFAEKNKQILEDNPRFVSLAGSDKEVQLRYIDQKTEIPSRGKMVAEAINLISKGKGDEWSTLPTLLRALSLIVKKPLTEDQVEKVIRRAAQQHKISVILGCLSDSKHTGWSLKQSVIYRNVLFGIRNDAQDSGWQESSMLKAMKNLNEVARLLELEEHRTGSMGVRRDPRKRPDILGVFLELAGINAIKHQSSEDHGGLVRAYAQRLLANIQRQSAEQPEPLAVVERGPQHDFLATLAVYHGLILARQVLGTNTMPQPELARNVISNYKNVLEEYATILRQQKPERGTYAHQALKAWEDASQGVVRKEEVGAGKKVAAQKAGSNQKQSADQERSLPKRETIEQ